MTKLKIFFIIGFIFLSVNQEAIAGNFIDNGDGTVTDNNTKLIWQKIDDSIERTWEEAITYCEGLSLAGHTDWRLPDTKQLASIVDIGKFSPTIDTTYFPNTKSSKYWSATTYANDSNNAWYVYFYYGFVSYSNKTSTYYVRCVR